MTKKYMKHPKLRRRLKETDEMYAKRRKADRAKRRREAKPLDELTHRQVLRRAQRARKATTKALESVPLKIVHEWIADRDIYEPHIVLRIDDYNTQPADRGQYYPKVERTDDKGKAIWGSREQAQAAAEWAVKQFGRQYGVFKMVAIVETTSRPVRVVEV